MRSLKYVYAFLALTILFPLIGHAEEAELRGYTPPPMFGSSMSIPVDTPPAPANEQKPAAPAIEKPKPPVKTEAPKPITKPPADKEIIVKDTPLPIKSLTPKALPKKPTTVPEKDKLPPYVAPKPKVEEKKEAKAQPVPVKSIPPEVKEPAINAEALLNHPVTSQTNPMPVAEPINPLAAPASKVEDGLPLPGSVPTKKKSKVKKADIKRTEAKKPVVKAKKAEPVKKQEPKKSEPKPKTPEPKPVIKKEAVKAALPVETKKVVVKEKPVAPAPVKAAPKLVEKKTEKKSEPYNVKGFKSMPKVPSTKVDKAEIGKLPLPAIEEPKVKTMPTVNEQIIDKALKDHMIEPDVKKIIGEPTKPPATKSQPKTVAKTETKPKIADTPANIPSKPTTTKAPIKPELISLEFSGASAELASDQKKVIDSSIIAKLKEDDSRRLQILSFASPAKEGQSSARRISLSRGLAIRSYLLEKGVQPSRIDIRALGENTKEKPMDRVDLALIYLR